MSEIERLVLEECKYPYIKQTSEGYRITTGVISGVLAVFSLLCLFFWLKLRHLPRIAARPIFLVIVLYIVYAEDLVGSWVVIATSNSPNFLNSCSFQLFSPYLIVYAFLVAMVLKLLFYFFRYRLVIRFTKQVTSENENMLTSHRSLVSAEDDETRRLHSYTTDSFLIKTTLATSLFGIILFGTFSLLHCPDFNDNPPFKCPNEEDSNVESGIYIACGVILVALLISVGYATFNFHDPFGIVREVLLITILYVAQFVLYVGLKETLPPLENQNRSFTPLGGAAILSFAMFVVVIPMQLILAKKDTLEPTTLHETLHKCPILLKLFRLHLQRELSQERLDFYMAVEKYKEVFDNSGDVKLFATSIIERFIEALASEEVTVVGYDEKQKVIETMKNSETIPKDIFTKSQEIVFSSMETGSHISFINGPLYRLYLGIDSLDIDNNNVNTMI